VAAGEREGSPHCLTAHCAFAFSRSREALGRAPHRWCPSPRPEPRARGYQRHGSACGFRGRGVVLPATAATGNAIQKARSNNTDTELTSQLRGATHMYPSGLRKPQRAKALPSRRFQPFFFGLFVFALPIVTGQLWSGGFTLDQSSWRNTQCLFSFVVSQP
jgi:hypothetical protein